MKRHILGKLLKLRNYGLNKKTTSGDELGEEVPDNADAIRIFINAINKEVSKLYVYRERLQTSLFKRYAAES